MINEDGTGEYFPGKQTVPPVCLRVSLAGKQASYIYKGSVLSGEETYLALSVQLGSTLALEIHFFQTQW